MGNDRRRHVRDGARRDSARAVLVRLLKAEGYSICSAVRLLNQAGFRPSQSDAFTRQATGVWWHRALSPTVEPFERDPLRLRGAARANYLRTEAIEAERQKEVAEQAQGNRERRVRRSILAQSRSQ